MSDAVTTKSIILSQREDIRNLPDTIELFMAGNWSTPYHGDFEITIDDIDEAITNFNAGHYRAGGGSEPLPGTIDHMGGDSPAAFRIHSVYRVEDSMMAAVTWTELGKEKLARDEYRYISAEFNPRAFPFVDPEDADHKLVNVLTAATLTNDPLFKKLKPVLASVKAGVSDKRKGEKSMDLAALRAKKKDELTEEELKFLGEHKAELTEDERTEFGLEVKETEEEKTAREAKEAEAAKKVEEEDAAKKAAEEEEKLKASAGVKGTVTITAKELEQLKAGAAAGAAAQKELLKTRLTASVKEHVARGALKSGQLPEAVEILMASSEGQRGRLEKFLTALPSNKVITAGAQGSGSEGQETNFELTEEEKAYAKEFNVSEDAMKEFKKAQATQ